MRLQTPPDYERLSRDTLEAYLALRTIVDEELAQPAFEPDEQFRPLHVGSTHGAAYDSASLILMTYRRIEDRYLTCYLEFSDATWPDASDARATASVNLRRGKPASRDFDLSLPAISVRFEEHSARGRRAEGDRAPSGGWRVQLVVHGAYPGSHPARLRALVERLPPDAPTRAPLLAALAGVDVASERRQELDVSREEALSLARLAVRDFGVNEDAASEG